MIPPMTTTLKLRDYQQTCIDKVHAAFADGVNRPAVVLPTGSGKTVIFAHMASRWLAEHETRVVILVHRDELVRQAINKVKSIAPDVTVGVIKAKENDVSAPVVVASIQTLSRPGRVEQLLYRGPIGLVIVDEAHHAAALSYRETLAALGSFNGLPTVGFTATMVRGDSKKLGDVWQAIVFKRDILWMIRQGYLVDVKGYSVQVDDFDLKDVKQSRGDYQEGALGQALLDSSAGKAVAEAYQEYTPNQSALLFAPTVASTQMFADTFNEVGIPTEVVLGSTPPEARAGMYRRAQQGKTLVLANCMVLTEGFDMPRMSAVLNCRPTRHVGLYIQMCGRALRPYPGKDYATILDTTGVATEHSLSGIVDLAQSRKAKDVETGTPLSKAAAAWDEEPSWDDTQENEVELNLTEVDLFQRSHSVWLQTPGGIWFVPTGKDLFVLWPLQSGDFRVIRTPQANPRAAKKLSEDLPLDYAMAIAEAAISDEDPMLSSKTASWRKGKRSATNAQISFATSLGIDSPEQYTKSQLSDLISSVKAGNVLDPLMAQRSR
jgi:superfamily II DNA or RNA helicase